MRATATRNPRQAYRQAPTGQRSRGSMLLGLFLGLVLGVLISFGVVWYMNRMALPFRSPPPRAQVETDPAAAPAPLPGKPGDKVGTASEEKPRFEFYKILPGSQEAGSKSAGKPAAKPQDNKVSDAKTQPIKPAEPKTSDTKAADTKVASTKPTEAKQSDSKSTDTKQVDAKADPKSPEAKAAKLSEAKATGAPMFLQVGAFQKAADADDLKAKLALAGVAAGIQEVDIPEKGKMYRVRTGPFSSTEELNRVRSQLSQNGIKMGSAKSN